MQKTKKLTMRSLSKEDRDKLFSEYMHSIGQWETVNGQVKMSGGYMNGEQILDGFRNFIKSNNNK